MKTAIITAYLLTAKPDTIPIVKFDKIPLVIPPEGLQVGSTRGDTIPYLSQPYYSEDTLYTNQELRATNHKNAAKLKDAERNSLSVFLVGIVLGIVGGLGVAITIR